MRLNFRSSPDRMATRNRERDAWRRVSVESRFRCWRSKRRSWVLFKGEWNRCQIGIPRKCRQTIILNARVQDGRSMVASGTSEDAHNSNQSKPQPGIKILVQRIFGLNEHRRGFLVQRIADTCWQGAKTQGVKTVCPAQPWLARFEPAWSSFYS